MSQNLQNFVKFQKFQLENLVDFEKCCQTRIFLQKSVPIQPKTSNILPKICRSAVVSPGRPPRRARGTHGVLIAVAAEVALWRLPLRTAPLTKKHGTQSLTRPLAKSEVQRTNAQPTADLMRRCFNFEKNKLKKDDKIFELKKNDKLKKWRARARASFFKIA